MIPHTRRSPADIQHKLVRKATERPVGRRGILQHPLRHIAVVRALQFHMNKLPLRGRAHQIGPLVAHLGKLGIVPSLHLKTGNPGQQAAGSPHENTLQRNVIFMHSRDLVAAKQPNFQFPVLD